MAKTNKSQADEVEPAEDVARPAKDPQLVDFGRRLRELRLVAGLTQEDLAFAAGLHWTYVGQIERGERNLTYKNVLRLAVGLQVPAAELMPTVGVVADLSDEVVLEPEQLEALSLLAGGSTPQEAAALLGLSLPAFRQGVVEAQKRLGARNLAEAIERAGLG